MDWLAYRIGAIDIAGPERFGWRTGYGCSEQMDVDWAGDAGAVVVLCPEKQRIDGIEETSCACASSTVGWRLLYREDEDVSDLSSVEIEYSPAIWLANVRHERGNDAQAAFGEPGVGEPTASIPPIFLGPANLLPAGP